MAVSRWRFLSPDGDNLESFYEHKYLLNVPFTAEDDVVKNPPESWLELCAESGLVNETEDCLNNLHCAVARGFDVKAVKELAKAFVDNGFLTTDDIDAFMSNLPVENEPNVDEPSAKVADNLIGDDEDDLANLAASKRPGLQYDTSTFTCSQTRAYEWKKRKLDSDDQLLCIIFVPGGTGKTYLLGAVEELLRGRSLVVAKLAPSGATAHLIGGTTIHHWFKLDTELQTSLEHGTVHADRLRLTDVPIVDEFSMLDLYLFRSIEGLCCKFGRQGPTRHLWGGRHVFLLGDSAQIPPVSQKDIFGTEL